MRSEDTDEVILHIKGKEISTNLLNCIVHFSNQVQQVENKKMQIVIDNIYYQTHAGIISSDFDRVELSYLTQNCYKKLKNILEDLGDE